MFLNGIVVVNNGIAHFAQKAQEGALCEFFSSDVAESDWMYL